MYSIGRKIGKRIGSHLGNSIGYTSRGVSSIAWDALFDTRSGLTLTDSVGGEEITVKQFPVANYFNTLGYYSGYSSGEAPITTSGDYTVLSIERNENSDTVASSMILQDINGNGKGGTLSIKSGDLYNADTILVSSADLTSNASGKVVTNAQPWVWGYTFDAGTNVIKAWLNGTEIDSAEDSTWALGLASGTLGWRAFTNITDTRHFGVWVFDRKLTSEEMVNITDNGIWPAIAPSKQYVHLNYGDILSDRVVASHNRKVAVVGNNGSNAAPPDVATMWTSRYDNPVFAYALDYGYTAWGNFKIPYLPNKTKAMDDSLGDIEFPATSVIHNMAESLIDFSGVTDADIKAIMDKSNRTYWKASIEDEDHYTDAGAGYYGLWHPSQLNRTFITTHAETGHENHVFAGLRTSGQSITGITKIGIFKTNLE